MRLVSHALDLHPTHSVLSLEEECVAVEDSVLHLLTEHRFQKPYFGSEDRMKQVRLTAYQTARPDLEEKDIRLLLKKNRDEEIHLDLVDHPKISRELLIRAVDSNEYRSVRDKALHRLKGTTLTPEEARSIHVHNMGLFTKYVGFPRNTIIGCARAGHLEAYEVIEPDATPEELEIIAGGCREGHYLRRKDICERIVQHKNATPGTVADILTGDFFTTGSWFMIGHEAVDVETYTGHVHNYDNPINEFQSRPDTEKARALLRDRDQQYLKKLAQALKDRGSAGRGKLISGLLPEQ